MTLKEFCTEHAFEIHEFYNVNYKGPDQGKLWDWYNKRGEALKLDPNHEVISKLTRLEGIYGSIGIIKCTTPLGDEVMFRGEMGYSAATTVTAGWYINGIYI